MKTSITAVVIVLVMAGALTGGANQHAKVGVHVVPYNCNRACNRFFPQIKSLHDITATYDGCGDIDFFPVFFDLVEYKGFEYGVDWPGSYSCVFISCSYTRLGDIVWPGDGISQVWPDCQPYAVAIPGWGWLTIDVPGTICIVPHPLTDMITVADCRDPADLDYVDYLTSVFCAGVCGKAAESPGDVMTIATEPTTWGSIKGMFR
jgi:hypothetical protein